MKTKTIWHHSAVALASIGILFPQLAYAAGPAAAESAPPMIVDVALHDGGVLHGQVVDSQGQARAGAPITIHQDQQAIATATTDRAGRFVVTGLRGGVHQIQSSQGHQLCRLWAPHTAPPVAQTAALVVDNGGVVRGQQPIWPCVVRTAIFTSAVVGAYVWGFNAGRDSIKQPVIFVPGS